MNKEIPIAAIITAACLVIIPVATSHHREKKEQRIEQLTKALEQRDAFIREHLDTLFSLKDEFILNQSNEQTIHALDSLGLQFANQSHSIDYYRYALDINYLQEQLRK